MAEKLSLTPPVFIVITEATKTKFSPRYIIFTSGVASEWWRVGGGKCD